VGEVISAAIAGLSAEAREAIVLRDVEGLTAEQAAAIVGIAPGALKSRLHRARLALKQQLSAVLDEHPEGIACPELAQELSAYAGSDIDQAACERIEQHLSGCANCRQACEALKRTVSLCRAIPGGEVPASVKAAVRRALRAVVP
jgi:RNA polymerase sigma-70 factor (ECF subfamily)